MMSQAEVNQSNHFDTSYSGVLWKRVPLSNQAESGRKLSSLENILSRLWDIVTFRHNSVCHGIRDDSSQQNAILIRSKYLSWRWHKVHGAECSVQLATAQTANRFEVSSRIFVVFNERTLLGVILNWLNSLKRPIFIQNQRWYPYLCISLQVGQFPVKVFNITHVYFASYLAVKLHLLW